MPGGGCQRLPSTVVGKGYKESMTGREIELFSLERELYEC